MIFCLMTGVSMEKGKKMNDEIMFTIGYDGVAREYKDDYDITIHCESKEEQERAWESLTRRWIPCSERLPEYGVPVLTYDGDCYCVEKRIPYICDDNGKHLISDWWVSDDYDVAYSGYDSDYYPNLRDGACIAWMPLPDPPKGEE